MTTVTRTNLCTNPSFEAGITGWNATGTPAPAIAQSAAHSQNRSKSLKITWAAGNNFLPAASYVLATTPGLQYTVSVYVYVPTGSPAVSIIVGGLGLAGFSSASTVLDVWQRLAVTFTANAATHTVAVSPPGTPAGGEVCFIDSALFELAPNAATYFDGASSGCQWTGTADLSTSQQLSGPLSITVTNDLENEPPRRIIFVTGAPGTTAQINRTDPDGNTYPVRGADPASLTGGGQWAGFDVEGPYGQAATYTVVPSDSSPSVFQVVDPLATTQARFVHPGEPSLSVRIVGWYEDSERTYPTSRALNDVVGRELPIPIADGRRKGASYDASLKTNSAADTAAFRALISQDAVLLLQIVYPFTSESVWEYVSLGDVKEFRRTGQFGDPRRKFTFTCTVVDRPAGGVAAQWTIADLAVAEGTISAAAADYQTITGLALGIAGT